MLERDLTYKETGCAGLACQCRNCGNYSFECCLFREIVCPEDRDYDPSYVCPDFKQKEEPDNAP